MSSEKCSCLVGKYIGGSALYDFYDCGHAFEKPINFSEPGKWVYYKSPYPIMRKSYEEFNDRQTLKKLGDEE